MLEYVLVLLFLSSLEQLSNTTIKRKPDTKIQQDEPVRSRIPVRINDKFGIE